jgi:2-dehydro-3-deoxygalactonokinase
MPSADCFICIDTGTTNTRVWLLRGDEILARANAMTGVRDTALEASSVKLRKTLRHLISDLCSQYPEAQPQCIAAAGMITSPLGLAEIPHIESPAGIHELASAVQQFHFPEISSLPFLMVPGVRSGNLSAGIASIGECDVMRGEETLCAGLIASADFSLPATILNLGSHWKAIQLSADEKIHSSVTSLSGEMIFAVQTNTILASAVPQARAEIIDESWCLRGMHEQREAGLARALFCVRLLELQQRSTPPERFSFLAGAVIASDLDALQKQNILSPEHRVLITGGGAMAAAWVSTLKEKAIHAVALGEAEVETAFLCGLRVIIAHSQFFR